jgi:type IV pilus assembly protein PilY1
MFRKSLLSLITLTAIVISGLPAHADDIDLYLEIEPPAEGSEPMVMFSFDYRPNLGSVVCRRGDSGCDALVEDGYLPDLGDGEAYNFFDLIRGSFGKVLDEVGGVRLGLMFNHDHRQNCQGPLGASKPGCSNGGYIAMGFEELPVLNVRDNFGGWVDGRKSCGPFYGTNVPETNDDRVYGADCTDPTRKKIHEILWSIPVSEGDRTHSYQGKELFFELYRYLRGFHVYNGHTGFTSYDGNDGYDTTGDGSPDLLPSPLPLDAPNPNDPSDRSNEIANRWNLNADPLHVDYDPTAITAADQRDLRSDRYAWDADIETPVTTTANKDWYRYNKPVDETEQCTSIYTVNMMFQVSNQEDDSDPELKKPIVDEGLGFTNQNNITFPEVIEELRVQDHYPGVPGDQGVKSYFLLADPFVNNRTGGQYALAGGTGAPLLLSEDPDELIATLTEVFRQILAVSTTFVAASIPVNSFNRAEVLDNVYLALFQPNPDRELYWWGNVKKLRLAGLGSGGPVFLEDAEGKPAIAPDGRIRFDALTYWTDPTMYDVQSADPDLGELPAKDGRSVNRGGAGHKQKGFSGGSPGAANSEDGARRIFYDATGAQLADLDATDPAVLAAVQADFGAADVEETKTLIRWLRGQDVFDEDFDFDILGPEALTEGRRWYMASAIHSRPIPINYGARGSFTKNNPEIVVAVGTNDGLLRLIRNTPVDHEAGNPEQTVGYGEELWAFAPRATMNATEKLTRKYRALINLDQRPPYGVDGAPVVYIEENGDGTIQSGEKVWLFFGLRRGGRAYYGMDISEPESPSLLWRIDGGKGDEFDDLGYTFSTPTAGLVDIDGTRTPVLVFGGGYDPAYDGAGPGAGAASMGNAVYVVNAETGELVRKFVDADLLDAIPSPVTGIDLNGDGLLDRVVVGDMGGNVWRMDMPLGLAPAEWTFNRLGAFGLRAGADGDGQDRRFFHAPDVVPFQDSTGDYDAVVIGSGNRADPKGKSVDNYMFMIKDRAVSTINPPPSASLTPVNVDDLADITNCTQASTCAATGLVNGWKLELQGIGEKSLATPVTLAGIVFFSTFLPPVSPDDSGDIDAVCRPPEGQGRLYSVGLAEGNALVNRDKPISEQDSPGEPDDRWELLSSAGIPAEVVALPPNLILGSDLTTREYPGKSRWRTFWYREEEAGH